MIGSKSEALDQDQKPTKESLWFLLQVGAASSEVVFD